MLFESPAVERLIEAFRRLPGVGKRSAERYALHVLTAPDADAQFLSEAILHARTRIRTCFVCCNLTETDPCPICDSPSRDHAIVCVVEKPLGMMAIEKGGTYRGVYHVLNGALNPLEGIGPDELTVGKLMRRLQGGSITEVILATNATAEGEATALYLARRITEVGIGVSRIAHGVPMGSGLEFADDITLTHAMQGRTKM